MQLHGFFISLICLFSLIPYVIITFTHHFKLNKRKPYKVIRATWTFKSLVPSSFLYKFYLPIASEYFDRIFNHWPDFWKIYSSLGKNRFDRPFLHIITSIRVKSIWPFSSTLCCRDFTVAVEFWEVDVTVQLQLYLGQT